MNIFIDNSLASFINPLSEYIDLQEITFSTQFNNVTDTKTVYHKKDKLKASLKLSKDKTSRSYIGEIGEIKKGRYDEVEKLFRKLISII